MCILCRQILPKNKQGWQLPALENEVVEELRNIVEEERQRIQEKAKPGASLGKPPQFEEGHES